jgi:CheY-like chemotaxis protein
VTDTLHAFCVHMAQVARRVRETPAPAKVQRFVRMHQAGLPLDITVRWFPVGAVEEMETRVEELTRQGRQVWISQGLPSLPSGHDALASVEKKTDLLKDLESIGDFRDLALPRLQGWEQGSWAKLYYDTPARSLTGGTIGFDTNRAQSMLYADSRAVRFEAASGISDVRDLQRQMTAQEIMAAYTSDGLYSEICAALASLSCPVCGVGDLGEVTKAVQTAGPEEPRALILDLTKRRSEGLQLVTELKGSADTASIPLIAIVQEESELPPGLRTRVSDYVALPFSPERLRASVFQTGYRLSGDAYGLTLKIEDALTRREVRRLLDLVMGIGGEYRRIMARLANLEGRPTIAFEFKLVPIAPYEFFFLDYEWSGERHPLHRFDWLNSYALC